jgi:hypothetical protein
VLREAWGRSLEAASLSRTKTGFTVDVATWLRTRGRPLVERARAGLLARRVFHPTTLARAFDAWTRRLPSGHPAAWGPLFAMVQLEEQFARWGEPG